MEQKPKTSINTRNIAELFFYLFTISLFFPIKYVFLTSTTFKTGVFSDFTAISLYLSDILLFITWCWLILPRGGKISRGRSFYHVVKALIPLTIWLIFVIIWHFKAFSSLNAYYFLKFLEFFVAYGTITTLFQETAIKTRFFKLFAGLGTTQAFLALLQFWFQHPLGLFKLGEQQIYVWNQGIAKLIVNGQTFIRGYGTFPHPNPLSAFLIATILILVYLFTQAASNKSRIIYSLMLILSVFGLVSTFSRASFLALGLGLIIFFLFFVLRKSKKIFFVPLGTILISLFLAVLIFKPFLLTRATVSDSASLQRIFYAKVGWQIIKANPIAGVGIGESVLHMQQYSPIKLWPWQIQPIHNYYLLAAADLGIIGALILIWIFLSHLKKVSSRIYHALNDFKLTAYYLLLATILLSFLFLMFFDHYFYTLQQTQLLFWLILGAIASEINKNPYPSEERGRGEAATKSYPVIRRGNPVG